MEVAKRQAILIGDEALADVETLKALLGEDRELYFAKSGAETLDLAHAHFPSLVLVDLKIGRPDVFEVCRHLRADPRTAGIPVIVIRSAGEEAIVARALENGASDCIARPFSPPLVKARIRHHLELKGYRDLLENLSFIDGLTGISNRRRLDEQLDREWRRAARRGDPLSVVLIDIDYFRRFNEDYGTLAADDCLRRVAQALQAAATRPGDLVARSGRDKFAMVLPQTDLAGALLVAEVARQRVFALGIESERSSAAPCITISAGVAEARPGAGTSLEALLHEAHRKLRAAKDAGRNRIAPQEPEVAVG